MRTSHPLQTQRFLSMDSLCALSLGIRCTQVVPETSEVLDFCLSYLHCLGSASGDSTAKEHDGLETES